MYVQLISDDAALLQQVAAAKPAGAALQTLSHEAFRVSRANFAGQCWVDLRDAEPMTAPTAGSLVILAPPSLQPPAHWPSSPIVRLPISTFDLAILWGTARQADSGSGDRGSDLHSLPAWLLDYLAMDVTTLCRALCTTLPRQLGFTEGLLFVADSAATELVASTSSISDVVRSSRLMASTESEMSALLAHFNPVSGNFDCAEPRLLSSCQNASEAVLPLVSREKCVGALKLLGRDAQFREPATLPLISLFLGTALQQAQRLAKESNEARIDCLTGLCNLRSFQEILQAEVQRANRFSTPLSMIALDMDGLKKINDQFGHLSGDEVLKHAAACMSAQLRGFDIAARVGGDEFLILLPATDGDGAEQVAARVLRQLEDTPLSLHHATIQVGLSAGIAQFKRSWSADEFRRAADDALYASKAARPRHDDNGATVIVRFRDDPLESPTPTTSQPASRDVVPTADHTAE
ncbi:MAG: GGDEF domain-containing protein [Phycisphaerae bacterium]